MDGLGPSDAAAVRILVVKNLIAPNTTPLFEELAGRDDCVLRVVYETDTEANRHWTVDTSLPFDAEVLRSRTLHVPRLAPESYVHVPRQAFARLRAFSPDVVVASGGVWSSPTNFASLVGRKLNRWAFVPWWGEFRSPWRSQLTRLIEPWKRRFVSGGDAWLAYSHRAARDAVRLGADARRVVVAPNTPRRPEAPGTQNGRVRGAGGRTRFLFSGQLIERKGIRTLLEAFQGLDAELWISGNGPLRGLVQARAATDPTVHYLGHLDWEELEPTYHRADVLVLPSLYDVWGLVVNEAAERGMAVIVSDQVGAAEAFPPSEEGGRTFQAGSVASLRAALQSISGWTVEEFDRCSRVNRRHARRWSVERAADAVLGASRLALGQRTSLTASSASSSQKVE